MDKGLDREVDIEVYKEGDKELNKGVSRKFKVCFKDV